MYKSITFTIISVYHNIQSTLTIGVYTVVKRCYIWNRELVSRVTKRKKKKNG